MLTYLGVGLCLMFLQLQIPEASDYPGVFGVRPPPDFRTLLCSVPQRECFLQLFYLKSTNILEPLLCGLKMRRKRTILQSFVKSQTLSRPMPHGYDLHKCPMVQFFSLFFLLPSLPIVSPMCFLEALSHVDWVVGFSPLPSGETGRKLQQVGPPFLQWG